MCLNHISRNDLARPCALRQILLAFRCEARPSPRQYENHSYLKEVFVNFSKAGNRALVLVLAGAAVAAEASAAGYVWLERSGDTVQARQGQLLPISAGKGATAPVVLNQPRVFFADGKALEMERKADAYVVRTAPSADLRFTAVEATSQGVLTHYQARFGRAETTAMNDLELVPTEPNGNTYKLMWKGSAVVASQVSVEHSEGWRRTLTPAKDGTVSFMPWMPGLYVLEVSARVNDSSVMYEGRKYDDVRHTVTLSFEVPRVP